MKTDQLDFSEISTIIRRRIWLGIIPIIIVPIATFVIANFITPIYESSVTISMGNTVRLSRDVQRFLGDIPEIFGSVQNRRGELQDLRNEIASTPYLAQVVSLLGQDKNSEVDKVVRRLRETQPHMTAEELKQGALIRDLRDHVRVDFVGRALIRVSVHQASAEVARDLAEKLGEVFITERRKRDLGLMHASSIFSFDQLEKYETELQKKIDSKTELEKEYLKIQLDASVASEQNRKEISGEIENANLQIEAAKNDEKGLLADLTDIPSYVLKLHESSDLIDFRKQIREHCETLQNLLQQQTWNTPVILNLKVKLYDLEEKINEENERLVQDHLASYNNKSRKKLLSLFNIRTRLDILYLFVNSLELSLNYIESRINLMPDYQARIGQITREIETAQAFRDRFLAQQEGLQISQALLDESAGYRVIEPAEIAYEPIWPDKEKLGLIGLVIGLILGTVAIVLAELLDKSFKKIEEVEEFLGKPVAGIVPEIKGLKKMKFS